MEIKTLQSKRVWTSLLFVLVWFTGKELYGQDTEQWRHLGYQAKEMGNYGKAIRYYSRILSVNPDDYDARLALGRLYNKTEQYKKAENIFRRIYAEDSTDVEAMIGLGDAYLMTDRLKKAIEMYKKAIRFLPLEVPYYFKLAKAYSWNGELDKAIETYRQILEIDNTYSEAYQGIGKMYYWMEKPFTALSYYKKAIALDPNELPLQKEYDQIRNETAWKTTSKSALVNEVEENYTITALNERIGFSKRLNNWAHISGGFLLDFSNRDFIQTNAGDTTRLYDNTFLKTRFITNHHRVDIYGGYTVSDAKFSSYGLAWRSDFGWGKFDFVNNLSAGYEYFYYWNQVGHYHGQEKLDVKYRRWKFSAGVSLGIVDPKPIMDVPNDRYEVDTNPFYGYETAITYRLFDLPKTEIGLSYSYLTYTYKSAFYYSPLGRHLMGLSVSVYYPLKNFYLYGHFSYNPGSEYYFEKTGNNLKTVYLDITNWSLDAEAGYRLGGWEFSVVGSRFYNPFYQNLIGYFSINYSFQ